MSFPSELRLMIPPSRPRHLRVAPDLWLSRPRPAAARPYLGTVACMAATYVLATGALAGFVMPEAVDRAWSVLALAGIAGTLLAGMLGRRSRQHQWNLARVAAACLPLVLLLAALQCEASSDVRQATQVTSPPPLDNECSLI